MPGQFQWHPRRDDTGAVLLELLANSETGRIAGKVEYRQPECVWAAFYGFKHLGDWLTVEQAKNAVMSYISD